MRSTTNMDHYNLDVINYQRNIIILSLNIQQLTNSDHLIQNIFSTRQRKQMLPNYSKRPEYYFDIASLYNLFNRIIEYKTGYVELPIGQCVDALNSVRDFLEEFVCTGQGNRSKLRERQAIIGSLVCVDNECNLRNKELLKELLLFSEFRAREFISDCTIRRALFNLHESDTLCKEYGNEKRDRMPMDVKQSIYDKYTNSSTPHPSLTVIIMKSDIDNRIIYDKEGNKMKN